MARTAAVQSRISRARYRLGAALIGARRLEAERMHVEWQGRHLVFKYSDKAREYVLEGELTVPWDRLELRKAIAEAREAEGLRA